jgi:hypothetical protein
VEFHGGLLAIVPQGSALPVFLEAIRGFMPEIAEMRHYGLTGVQSRKPAQPSP